MSKRGEVERLEAYPDVFQGGMGIAISNENLASHVAAEGAVGIVSLVACGEVFARRLQDGQLDSLTQTALEEFSDKRIIGNVICRYYLPDGRPARQPYIRTPKFHGPHQQQAAELNLLGAYVEVRRAKLHAQMLVNGSQDPGPIGVNLLTKVEQTTPSALYGAMLAGVDLVVMGAGIPAEMPLALDNLARRQRAATQLNVAGSLLHHEVRFDPRDYPELADMGVTRPPFLAIVASNSLAKFLTRDPESSPDGLVIEGPTAGGHNAPPRGKVTLDSLGQPVYGPRDEVHLDGIAQLDLPFWIAGGYGTPGGLSRAKAAGAKGIQAGSVFAVCKDSGMVPRIRQELIQQALDGGIDVRTSPVASPTGYPIKIAQLRGTLSDQAVYERRRRVCDVGLLSEAYTLEDGSIGYRCPAEPVKNYVKHGGEISQTIGTVCLCNTLFATANLAQLRQGHPEPITVTLGDAASETIREVVEYVGHEDFGAGEVVRWLRSGLVGGPDT